MQPPLPSPSVRQIPRSSDSRPSKRAKVAAAGHHEARGGRAKAERWYNDSNNNASGTKDIAYFDSESSLPIELCRSLAHQLLDDPPFYLNKKTCSGSGSACAVHSDRSSFDPSNLNLPTAPTRSLLAQMEANESNSEDFRSVIDDLTIQNKKLRKKLKQYQSLHCAHLQAEKLFEVRIHALAAHRKHELEEILRTFASSSGDSPGTSIFNVANFKASAPALMDPNPSSSSTSCSKDSKPIDSAYASMSGQAMVSQKPSQDYPQKVKRAQSNLGQQNVKSYLHDIPETLVPKDSLAMSERAKSRLVVRRLEQIFTGRRAAPPRQNQSHQQQEVSQSAAKADRFRLESRGRKLQPKPEGQREARILPTDAELKVDSLSEASLATQQSRLTVESRGRNARKEGLREVREVRILSGCAESQIDSSSETNLTNQQSRQSTDGENSWSRDPRISREVTPDQRPTRPIDLDLHRAQVPSDNIEYIRHLGLALPTASSDTKPDSDDGWVFLNLLISMAQLHTLNVTPDFIRHAIAEVSSKFELSTDGTKVRWRGGTDGTQMSSDSDESDETGHWKSATDIRASVSKHRTLADTPSRAGPEDSDERNGALLFPTVGLTAFSDVGAKRRPVYLEHPHDVDKFQYKPLFFHGTASKDEDASAHSTNSVSSFDPMENSTGLNSRSHGIRESDVKLRKQNRENGPIIFYNKANFCTDLSGDSSGAMHDKATYSRYIQEPIGSLQQADSEEGDESESDYVAHEDGAIESMDLANGSTSTTRSALDLEDLRSSISDLSATSPITMEVSGLGGIQPEDNFMVKVKVCHRGRRRSSRAQSPFSAPSSQARRLLRGIPRGLTSTYREAKDIPRSQPNGGPIKSEIISTIKTDMPPSSLPPPSYVCLPFSSSESDDGDDEDEDAGMNYYSGRPRASANTSVEDVAEPRSATLFLGSSSDESVESSYLSTTTGSDDDSSIDFLANARELDPDTIAAQEREFDIHSMQQPARAGSMAVTLGELTSTSSGQPRMAKKESDTNSMSVDGDDEK